MKKQYLEPTTQVYVMHTNQALMTGSLTSTFDVNQDTWEFDTEETVTESDDPVF